MREYHLHKGDYSKLQLEVQDAMPYCQKNVQHCFKPHRHSFYQIIWFKKAGKHFVDYQEYQHEANSIYFLNIGQVHYFCKASDNQGLLIHFNDIFLTQQENDAAHYLEYNLFNELGRPFVALGAAALSDFKYLAEKLRFEIEEKASNYGQQLYHYLQILLLQIERQRKNAAGKTSPDQHFTKAMRFKKMIESTKDQFYSVAHFSQQLGISPKTLTTISKKYFKRTPARMIHEHKILEAKRLLSNAKLSIKEIAYELGFKQATYFTKYFKKYTHLTPKQFREQFP